MTRGRRIAVGFVPLACALLACVFLAASLRSIAQERERAGVPLYEHIRSHIDPATGRLREDAMVLPDESTERRFGRLRSGPGALEGLGSRHMRWDASEKTVRTVYLLEQIADGNTSAEPVLYELLRADDIVTFYTDALDYAASRITSAEPELHDVARRFATQAPDRGPVKFGIAMLGAIGDPADRPIVQTLALHDEFGLYAAEALAELAPEGQAALFEMARKVNGWGRIEAVTRMVYTSDPALRRWLLTEGFHNTVTPQYVAYQCATIADLAGALAEMPEGSKADVPLLIGAAELIQALVRPGPAMGLGDYADGPQMAEQFLRHVLKRRDSASFYLAADALREYVAALDAKGGSGSAPPNGANSSQAGGESASGGAPAAPGIGTVLPLDAEEPPQLNTVEWSPEQRQVVAELSKQIVSDRRWRRYVKHAIARDETNLDQAEEAAKKLGINTYELHVSQLAKGSTQPRRWEIALAAADGRQIQRLVEIADRTFEPRLRRPRAQVRMQSGSGSRASAGPEDADGSAALEAVVRAVARYPGSGLSLVEPCLTDEDSRVRRAAVETLVQWGDPYLRSVSVRAALDEAARTEPDLALKARMVALLNLGTRP